MAEGFLGRWSQRKQALRAGQAVAEPAPPVIQSEPIVGLPVAPDAAQPTAPAPSLSLDDVKSLTAESNFAPFAAREVAPEVRNAAMKKLFTDPHYNLMDRLDIYIDDYSQADPLPESMLRQMASAKFLRLFQEQEESTQEQPAKAANAEAPPAQPSQSGIDPVTENQPPEPGIDHDHTDLRLQPNDAAGRQPPGRVPQRNPDAA